MSSDLRVDHEGSIKVGVAELKSTTLKDGFKKGFSLYFKFFLGMLFILAHNFKIFSQNKSLCFCPTGEILRSFVA